MVEHNHDGEIFDKRLIAEAIDEDELSNGSDSATVQGELIDLIDSLKEAGLMKWAGSTITATVNDAFQYTGEDADVDGEAVTYTLWTEETLNEITIATSAVGAGDETAVLDTGTLTVTLDDSTSYSAADIQAIILAEETDIYEAEISEREATASTNWAGTTSLTNAVIEGALVKAYNNDKTLVATGTTDASGEVDLEGLRKEEYTVEANKAGYTVNDETVTITADSSTETQTISLVAEE